MLKKLVVIGILSLLMFSCSDENVTKNISAVAKVRHDYQKPSETKPDFFSKHAVSVEPCSLDSVNNSLAKDDNRVANKSQVVLVGWAANVPKGVSAEEVWLELSGEKNFYIKLKGNEPRPDVVSYFNKPGMLKCGWSAYVDLSSLSAGDYKVRVIMPEAGQYLISDTKRRLILE